MCPMTTIHAVLTISTGLLAVVAVLGWRAVRGTRGAGGRAWACIDLPSPDTPRTFPARCRDWLRNARLADAPAVLLLAAALLLTVATGVSALIC